MRSIFLFFNVVEVVPGEDDDIGIAVDLQTFKCRGKILKDPDCSGMGKR